MKNKKGFTLIELIVVLAILAIIAAIAVPTAFGSIEKARNAADSASIEAYNSAIRMQAVLLKADPASLAGADNTVTKAIEAANITAQTFQSKNVKVVFNKATATSVASFTITFDAGSGAGLTGDIATALKAVKPGDTADKTAGEAVCTLAN